MSGPLSADIADWLDSGRPCFQIRSTDFKAVGAKPVRLIPTYSAEELPWALRSLGLEQIRNQSGGCVLVNRAALNLPTLFPMFPHINVIHLDKPPQFPVSLKLLQNDDIHNEETGIVLANEMGLYSLFFERIFSSREHFTLGGRIKTSVSGNYIIGGEEIPVDRAQLEIDNFLESSSYLVPIEAKIDREDMDRRSFSIHQFALPTLLLSQLSDKRIYSLFQIYSVSRADILNFRFYLYDIDYTMGSVVPHSYRFVDGVQYKVPFENFLFS